MNKLKFDSEKLKYLMMQKGLTIPALIDLMPRGGEQYGEDYSATTISKLRNGGTRRLPH